jgi:polyisoprenoid-binding protein YceI
MRRLLVFLFAWGLWAQPAALQIDPTQTKVEYTLGASLHTVHGTFQLKRGTITFDSANGKVSGEVVVDATSGTSGNSGRDRRMHESILETTRYPDIMFRPERVEGPIPANGHSQIQVHGVFSVHGSEHEMDVPVAVDAEGGQYRAVAKFTIPYVQWGIKNPSTFLLRVSDKVEITIRMVAR